MTKLIKISLILLTSILFLTACSFNDLIEPATTSETKQKSDLDEKINHKQKYIVIQQDYDLNIEEKANFMNSKNYELKHQNISFTDFGNVKTIILTFEYKGQ